MAHSEKQSGGALRGRRRKGQGPDLRESILDAAEDLFSRHGFHGVTVRQVAAEAGVDTALIHYYFGAKRELFDHVFARRAEILNGARLQAIAAYRAAHTGGDLDPEAIIRAFIDPMINLSLTGDEGWKNYFRLVALVNNTPAWGGETMSRFFDPVVRQLVDALRDALPQAEERDLYWCYQFLTGALMLALSETGRIDHLSGDLCRSTDLEAVRARLYAWCAAGLREVVSRRL
ncbi:TetR/AcrR family transcriptional regulator [uncultured Phenylobacterium sp.]|uniref:TetR/AcrR family transcriptional regulator n=1 Tax=uncultured Phenylobacterium sp. TaxID=349273 RepID=UPI0025DE8EE7|nr:TetR/AcrR family transcriptional regulator [uncultured Phenylobacterium sp.]